MPNILYLWDLANTLFPEKWNRELSGYDNFDEYMKARGVEAAKEPRRYEEGFREVYTQGEMYNLQVADGYQEVLTWAKNNEAFSTGLKECMDWRAEYLNPRVGFDVRSYLRKVNSTFDYEETNIKTQEMLDKYLRQKVSEGYDTVVYTDDKLKNCEQFREATSKITGLKYRLYNMLNDNKGIRDKGWYCEVGNLRDVMSAEL